MKVRVRVFPLVEAVPSTVSRPRLTPFVYRFLQETDFRLLESSHGAHLFPPEEKRIEDSDAHKMTDSMGLTFIGTGIQSTPQVCVIMLYFCLEYKLHYTMTWNTTSCQMPTPLGTAVGHRYTTCFQAWWRTAHQNGDQARSHNVPVVLKAVNASCRALQWCLTCDGGYRTHKTGHPGTESL